MLERLDESDGESIRRRATDNRLTRNVTVAAPETLPRRPRTSREPSADDVYFQLSPPIRFKKGRVYNGTD
jgi:hypothetical protein